MRVAAESIDHALAIVLPYTYHLTEVEPNNLGYYGLPQKVSRPSFDKFNNSFKTEMMRQRGFKADNTVTERSKVTVCDAVA